MRKSISFTLLVFLGVFISTHTVFSAGSVGFLGIFGGEIIDTTATEVKELEDFGYVCSSPGITIQVMSWGSKTIKDFIILYNVQSSTNSSLRVNQWIIGKYAGKGYVTCIHPESEDVQTVELDSVTKFGTSK